MKRVIKNQKKMKNVMYPVLGAFAVALFAITWMHPSYADNGLIIDDALDAIVLYGEVESSPENGDEETVDENQEEEVGESEVKDEVQSTDDENEITDNEGKKIENQEKEVEEPEVMENLVVETSEINSDDINSDDINHTLGTVLDVDDQETLVELAEPKQSIVPVIGLGDGKLMSGLDDGLVLISDVTGRNGNELESDFLSGLTINQKQNEISLSSIEPQGEEISITEPLLGDDEDRNNNFKYKIITITGSDGKEWIFMDRNLGAKQVRDGITYGEDSEKDYYGYYYQRGNNWGFSSKTTEGQDGQVRIEPYQMPSKFFNRVMIKDDSWDYGNEENNYNRNLRGGLTDTDIAKKGPCPEGWHVPSNVEWDAVFVAWKNSSFKSDDLDGNGKNFAKDLKLPPSGYRNKYYFNFRDRGGFGYYWSSTSSNFFANYLFYFPSLSDISSARSNYRSYGYSVRCLKNSQIKSIIFDPNGGFFENLDINETKDVLYSKNSYGYYIPDINIQIPNMTGYMFGGWYTDTTYMTERTGFVSESTTITRVFARWLDFDDLSFTFSGVTFTIMDRNLGAKSVAEGVYKDDNGGEIENSDKLGYYYQWGNNYGFDFEKNIYVRTGDKIDFSIYGPLNYYINSIYRTDYSTSSNYNRNLWGGDKDINLDVDRQGPCPLGYHIPTISEWTFVYTAFLKQKNEEGEDFCGDLNEYKCFSKKLKLPFAGDIFGSDSYGRGYYGYYWSATPFPNDVDAYFFNVSDSYVDYYHSIGQKMGISVRCFKNDDTIKMIQYETNGGNIVENPSITKRYWEKPIKLLDSVKPGYVFKGWYTTSGFDEGSRVVTNAIATNSETDVIKLYAKWKEGIENPQLEDFVYKEIPVIRPKGLTDEDGPAWFIVMDRNLGAVTDDVTSTGSYGYHYQWGNNYGFQPECYGNYCTDSVTRSAVTVAEGGAIWDKLYNNRGYWGTNFIKGTNGKYDYRLDGELHNSLWGGSGDNASNNWGTIVINFEERQGPCPEGWHVPSAGEWGTLFRYWAINNGVSKIDGSNGLFYVLDNSSVKNNFIKALKLNPLAGSRFYSDGTVDVTNGSYYWTSSPYDDSNYASYYAYMFRLYDNSIRADLGNYRAHAYSVRCFKNPSYSFKTLRFDSNGGSEIPSQDVIEGGVGIVPSAPVSDRGVFVGWYIDKELSQEFDFDTPIIQDMVLYAKWKCNTGYVLLQGDGGIERNCFKFDTIVVTGSNGEEYVLMDRNLGAKQYRDGDSYDEDAKLNSYGYYYQRGNNRGFSSKTKIGQTGQVIVELNQMPSKFSSSSWIYTSPWDNGNEENNYNKNLRGDLTDTEKSRQGPCPEGWHVPSSTERGLIYDAWSGSMYVDGKRGIMFAKNLKMPFGGWRNNETLDFENYDRGFYWTSSPSGYSGAYREDFVDVYVRGGMYTSRSQGLLVRCLKNSPDEKVLIYDPNGGAFPGKYINENVEVIYSKDGSGNYVPNVNVQIPNRKSEDFTQQSGWMFAGWYVTQNGQEVEWLGNIDEIRKKQDVHAKWLPFNDLKLDMGGGRTVILMDRNMGAESVASGTYGKSESLDKLGFYYQWGNNYGFKNSGTLNTSGIRVDGDDYGPGNYYYDRIYRTISTNPLRWTINNNENLWGGKLNADIEYQGPCPNGYHIPNDTEWSYVASSFNSRKNDTIEGQNYCSAFGTSYGKCFASKLKLPFAGYRSNSNGSTIYNLWGKTYYWSVSSPYDSNTTYRGGRAGMFMIDSSTFEAYWIGGRSQGRPVRCLKNSGKPIIFNTNGGSAVQNANTIRWYESSPSNLSTPTHPDSHMEFNGWYTTPNFEKGSLVVDNNITGNLSSDVINLYAKWECEEGYNKVGNSCEGPSTAILLNGMTFNTTLKTLAKGESVTSYQSGDELIKGFVWSGSMPPEGVNKVKISIDDSEMPIWAWFDSTNGIVYYHSDTEKIYLNPDSNFMFSYFSGLTSLNLSNLNPKKVNGIYYFIGSSSVKNLNLDNWDVRTSGLGCMFQSANSLRNLSLKKWKIPQIFQSMIGSRSTCLSAPLDSVDVSYWDLSNTWDISGLFGSLNTKSIEGLDTWDTSNITNMSNMFGSISNLTGLNLSGWDTRNVINMSSMFLECYELINLDISSFDTSNVTMMNGMFVNSNNLKTIYVSENFKTDKVSNDDKLFEGAISLVGGNGTVYSGDKLNKWYAVIDDRSHSGYFTDVVDKPYTITYNLEGGVLSGEKMVYTQRTDAYVLLEPTKEGYTFIGWTGSNGNIPEVSVSLVGKKGDLYFTANWEKIVELENGGNSSGRGGNGSSIEFIDTHNSAEDKTIKDIINELDNNKETLGDVGIQIGDSTNVLIQYTVEEMQSYQFAKSNGITTTSSIKEAKMNASLTRIEMAKMLSNYAINVLGKTPDTTKTIKFKDVSSKKDKQYDNGVTLSYQLGIMGQNVKNNKFRPNDEVTRAEFVTALSRLLYGTPEGINKGTKKYYEPHMAKLYNEGIINNTDPNMKEKRGYVMTMLMRSAK